MASALTALVSVPIGQTRKHRIYGLSDRVTLIKSSSTFSELVLLGPDGTWNNAGCEMLQSAEDRWAWVEYEGRVYFTNLHTPIHVITGHPYVSKLGFGNVVVNPAAEEGRDKNPKARYIEVFFDHLVIADVDFNGRFANRLQWSDLYNFNLFNPARTNESDWYDILISAEAEVSGITGLGRIGSQLFTYTSTGIWVSQYFGLPTIIQTEQLIPDVGNDFKYGLIKTERSHFFISKRWKNVFEFNGQQIKPIGDPIIDFFLSDLSTNSKDQQMTWGYVDTRENELVWCYKSIGGGGTYDKEIVYHLQTRKWYSRSAENLTAFSFGGRTGKLIENLAGSTIASLTGDIEGLGAELSTLNKLWGDGTGRLLTEGSGTMIDQPVPILETNDLLYDEDLSTIKEIESLIIQASLGTAKHVQVYVSTRDNLDDPVTFTLVNQTWIPTLREKRLSLPRTNTKRVIRYRFVPVINDGQTSIDNFVWTNFQEFVYNAKAEK